MFVILGNTKTIGVISRMEIHFFFKCMIFISAV